MNKVVTWEEFAILRGLKSACAQGPEPAPHRELSNPGAAETPVPGVRLTFPWADGGEPLRIPAVTFVDVAMGDLPLEALPEEVIRAVLGQWVRARLAVLRESGE